MIPTSNSSFGWMDGWMDGCLGVGPRIGLVLAEGLHDLVQEGRAPFHFYHAVGALRPSLFMRDFAMGQIA
jgi:hypothetical protein